MKILQALHVSIYVLRVPGHPSRARYIHKQAADLNKNSQLPIKIPTVHLSISTQADIEGNGPSLAGAKHYFDTFRFVKRLENEGFSALQSSAIMTSLNSVIQEGFDVIRKNAVTLEEQEKYSFQYKADFSQLKSEVHTAEKNDYAILKADSERLGAELDKLRERMREEINKLQAGFRLDMSLEKGRMRDETGQQEVKVQETDNRIKQEMFNLRAQMETLKFDIVKYVIGTIGTTGALFLGYLRLFK